MIQFSLSSLSEEDETNFVDTCTPHQRVFLQCPHIFHRAGVGVPMRAVVLYTRDLLMRIKHLLEMVTSACNA